MLLRSTVRHFADDLPDPERSAFLSAIASVPVVTIQLDTSDTAGALLNGETELAVVTEDELLQVLSEKGFPSDIIVNMHNRMMMITPIGERDAFLNFTRRTNRS